MIFLRDYVDLRRWEWRVALLITFALVIPGSIGYKRGMAKHDAKVCQRNLELIEMAKETWGMENYRRGREEVGFAKLIAPGRDGYLQTMPRCPEGGCYSVNSLFTPPTCPSGLPDHVYTPPPRQGYGHLPGQRFCCFAAGTLVWTPEGAVPIESVRVGDKILAHDMETGQDFYRGVVKLFRATAEEVCDVEIAGGETLRCSPNHLYWVDGARWVQARDLKEGMGLTGTAKAGSTLAGRSDLRLTAPIPLFNFEVEGVHTYYAGRSRVLTHNCE